MERSVTDCSLSAARAATDTARPLLQASTMHLYDYLDAGKTRTPEFLKRNPNGRIPTLELDDGTNLAESNAILWYLGDGSPFVPADKIARAQVLQWMFFEQYSHEPYVA